MRMGLLRQARITHDACMHARTHGACAPATCAAQTLIWPRACGPPARRTGWPGWAHAAAPTAVARLGGTLRLSEPATRKSAVRAGDSAGGTIRLRSEARSGPHCIRRPRDRAQGPGRSRIPRPERARLGGGGGGRELVRAVEAAPIVQTAWT